MNDAQFSMVWWIVGLPVFGFLIQALLGKIVIDQLGRKVGRAVMGAIAVAPIAIGFAIAVVMTMSLASRPADDRMIIMTLYEWMTIGNLSIPFEFRVDTLSMTMTLIITGIGSLIHLYAVGYMAEDEDFPRFFTYLNLFVAMMLTLVLGNNLVLLFVGWEGVGVCSYLLVGFWYKDIANAKAANKAFIVNRVGDFGLCLGLFLIVFMLSRSASNVVSDPRWLSYDVILPNMDLLLQSFGPQLLAIAAFLLFVGAMGKSAQFPLYVWLPDAMAGPTPVSALIHAATMVTSGVFLLNRMSPLFEAAAPWANGVVALVGAFTALLGALIAFGQSDIKKVLAFSTVSQLGYMFIACGVGAYWVGLFHVTTHAFFKALLFLGSGAVIYAMAHQQDMRWYGKLKKYLPITAITMIIGWLSIAGFPFFAGFFSKEQILHSAFAGGFEAFGVPVGIWVGGIALFVAGLTAAYMTRMTMMTFYSGDERWRSLAPHGHDHDHHLAHDHDHGESHGPDTNDFFYTDSELASIEAAAEHEHHHELDKNHQPKEVPWSMWVPLVALAILSVFGGAWLEKGKHFDQWLASGNAVVVTSHEEGHGNEHATAAEHEESAGNWFMTSVQEYSSNWMFWGSLAAFLLGAGYGISTYGKKLPVNDGMDLAKWNPLRKVAGKQFYYDAVVSDGSVSVGGKLASFLAKFDKGVIDGLVVAVGKITTNLFGSIKRFQSGNVRGYAVMMQVGIGILLLLFLYVMAFGSVGGTP